MRKDVCEEQNVTEYETYTVTECSSFYLFMDEEECEYHWEGEGENKKWVVMPGSCRRQQQPDPQDECQDVTRQREKQVPRTVCREVEEELCVDEPREECYQVTDEVCSETPKEDNDDEDDDAALFRYRIFCHSIQTIIIYLGNPPVRQAP